MKIASKPKKSNGHSSLFQRGYEPAREEKKRQDEAREASGKRLYGLFLKDDGDEATVRFLTEEPVNFYAHTVRVMRGGKERFDTCVCTQDEDCDLCADGDRPSFKGAYLIYDKRTFDAKDRKTGKTKKVHGQIRLYIQGMRVIGQLDRLSKRYGLTKYDYTITRSGSGQSTTYMFDREADSNDKLSKKEIENLLPEKLRDMYDGTMESLYSIVEEQIELMLPGNDDIEEESSRRSSSKYDDDDEDEDDAEELRKHRRNLVSDDDEDEDDEDDDEDEEPSPRKSVKALTKKNPTAVLGKKSAKKLLRGR